MLDNFKHQFKLYFINYKTNNEFPLKNLLLIYLSAFPFLLSDDCHTFSSSQ